MIIQKLERGKKARGEKETESKTVARVGGEMKSQKPQRERERRRNREVGKRARVCNVAVKNCQFMGLYR